MVSADLFCSTEELASLFGVTGRRIRQLAQSKVIPKRGRDRYNALDACSAYIKYLSLHGANAASEDAEALELRKLQAETEERESRARMAELELGEKRGELHNTEHVRRMITDLCVRCRSLLRSIPSKAAAVMASMNDPAGIASYLLSMIDEALTVLAEYDIEQSLAEEAGMGEDEE